MITQAELLSRLESYDFTVDVYEMCVYSHSYYSDNPHKLPSFFEKGKGLAVYRLVHAIKLRGRPSEPYFFEVHGAIYEVTSIEEFNGIPCLIFTHIAESEIGMVTVPTRSRMISEPSIN